MMLLLTVFYNIPEFDISNFFLMSCSSGKLNGMGNVQSLETNGQNMPQSSQADPERIRLTAPGSGSGPKYSQVTDSIEVLAFKL